MVSALIEAANAGRVVLAPNTELAAALFDAVECAHREAGRDIWATPRVNDFGGWLKELHIERQLADASTPRCLSDVEERELWRRVVLESEAGRQFLEPSGASRAARRARRAIAEYGIPLESLAAYGTEESSALIEWSERFSERCRALDCISAAQLLHSADRLAPANDLGGGITWIESPLWRPVARRWLERNGGVPLPPIVAEPSFKQRPRNLEAVSPAAELAAVAEWAQAGMQNQPAFRAWVCVRDLGARRAEVVDAFDAAMAPQRFALHASSQPAPYAIAGGTPLADYPPVRAALEFLSACGGSIAFERFSALLRAPEFQASASEAGAAARLDARLRSRAPSEAPLGEWLTLAERVARAQSIEPPAAWLRLNAASRALESFGGNHPISRWLTLWVAALEAGPWALRQRWASAEFQAAERFRELLSTLAVGDALFGGQSRRSAESILERAARDTPFQTQTGIPAIWVSGQMNDPWLAYDGVWVTGCEEARWPPPLDPIPLLPVTLQRQYGVIAASVESQLEFALDLQRRWLARARACVFSCADPGAGRRATLSPLLAAASATSASTSQPQPHWLAQWMRSPLLEELADEQGPAFGPVEKTRGVATLRSQSRCAFRGFAETRLAADFLERPLPGFNERERGELLHDALQRMWSELRTSVRLHELAARADAFDRLLAESARRAVAALCERRDPGPRWRERECVRLVGLMRRWLEFERSREPFDVERLEEGTEIARHAGLEFRVRVDRIDRLPDGALVLIDYKTGAAGVDWRGERPDNPQLPVYALLHRVALVAAAYARVNAAECSFVPESERANVFPGKRASKMEGMASFAELIRLWERRIENLAQEFAQGRAAVDPTPSACRSCRLPGLCRVPSTLETATALAERQEAS